MNYAGEKEKWFCKVVFGSQYSYPNQCISPGICKKCKGRFARMQGENRLLLVQDHSLCAFKTVLNRLLMWTIKMKSEGKRLTICHDLLKSRVQQHSLFLNRSICNVGRFLGCVLCNHLLVLCSLDAGKSHVYNLGMMYSGIFRG